MGAINKIKISLKNKYAVIWKTHKIANATVWLRGTVLFDDKFLRQDDLPAFQTKTLTLIDNDNHVELKDFLNQLNGFFAIVIQRDNSIFAAVDRVRSMPLFYGQIDEQVFLSDDAEWVRQNVGDLELNLTAREEFLWAGYVTGSETLFLHVNQIQAGEFLRISLNKNGLYLQRHRYYQYSHTEPDRKVNEDTLIDELSAVSEKIVRRLIEYANGRQIVVPLSSGYDSRLIVSLLRRLKYENVLTFSYGAPGNYESAVSQSVAKALNYPWEFVRYSNTTWRSCWKTEERKEYQWWASNWTSLPVFQDWPAVWQLKKAEKLEYNAVFAPGHSADLLAGSRSIGFPHLYDSNEMDIEQVIYSIIKFNYSLQTLSEQNKLLIKEKILGNFAVPDHKNKASAFEAWDIQERQAKFIINSDRVYEFWGYDWYLPFWEKDFIDFWQKIPLYLKKNENLYIRMVQKTFKKECNFTAAIDHIEKIDKCIAKSYFSIIRTCIKKLPLFPMIINSHLMKNVLLFHRHPLRWYGILNFKDFFPSKNNNYNGILAKLYLTDTLKSLGRKF